MAPKKPAKKADGESDTFDDFLKLYTKTQKEYNTEKIQEVVDNIAAQEAGEAVDCWNFSREFDPMAFRVLFHCLKESGYGQIKAIRLWRCGRGSGGDESVRSVCYYLDAEPGSGQEPKVKDDSAKKTDHIDVMDVHFTDIGVTPLGCEFLGRTLGPKGNKAITLLRLDYNQFGTAGVEKLSRGLSQNNTLRHLCMQYCAIGEDGGEFLGYILMYVGSVLEQLELRGNYLGNPGIIELFRGARRAKTLKTIDVFDNKFAEPEEVTDALTELMTTNTSLFKYDLGGNRITDKGASKIIGHIMRDSLSHITDLLVPEGCSQNTFDAIEQALGKGKKGGKKGKKGKKK